MSEPGANGSNGHAQDGEPKAHQANARSQPLPSHGGRGEAVTAGLATASERQQTMRLIEKGLRLGWIQPWQVPAELATTVPAGLKALFDRAIEDGNARVATRAADVFCRMAAHNLALAETVDHSCRLEGGEATEVITLRITPDE